MAVLPRRVTIITILHTPDSMYYPSSSSKSLFLLAKTRGMKVVEEDVEKFLL